MIGNGLTLIIILSSQKMRSTSINKLLLNQTIIDFAASFFLLIACQVRYLYECQYSTYDPDFDISLLDLFGG